MSESQLGFSKQMEVLILGAGAAIAIETSLVTSEITREFNAGKENEKETFTEGLLDLLHPKRPPSGIPEDAAHEMWPVMHSYFLTRIMNSSSMPRTTKNKMVEALMNLGGPNSSSIYQDYLSPRWGEKEVATRNNDGRFDSALHFACKRGFPDVIRLFSWLGKEELDKIKTCDGLYSPSIAERLADTVSSMVDQDSNVPLMDIFATIDAFVEMGYDIETFQSCSLQEKFNLYEQVDGVLHAAAKRATKESHFAIEAMSYLVFKGADPMVKNKDGLTPGDLIPDPVLKKQWSETVLTIGRKNAAMDILNELGISTPGRRP